MRLTPSAYAYDSPHHRIVRTIDNSADLDYDGRYCDALHNANYNVQLLLDDNAVVVERYEYEPYGERTVYISPGSNDPDCHAPTILPTRVQVGGADQPYGINETGFQGRPHCDQTSDIDHRTRVWNTRLAQWQQNDEAEYIDGMNRRAGYHAIHEGLDPHGRWTLYQGSTFTLPQVGKINQALSLIGLRTPDLIAELDGERIRLMEWGSCCDGLEGFRDKLQHVKEIIEKMDRDITSITRRLKIYHSNFGAKKTGTWAWAEPARGFGIGLLHSSYVEFNDGYVGGGGAWPITPLPLFAQKLFHELTHVYDTVDGGVEWWNNAHEIDKLYREQQVVNWKAYTEGPQGLETYLLFNCDWIFSSEQWVSSRGHVTVYNR